MILSIDCGIEDSVVEIGLFIMAVAVHCKPLMKEEEIEHAKSTMYVAAWVRVMSSVQLDVMGLLMASVKSVLVIGVKVMVG